MPWPESTVPKFGDWDSNADLSYSIVFDKARADKDGFLPSFKDKSGDMLSYQGQKIAPGLTKVGAAPHAEWSTRTFDDKIDRWYPSERGSGHGSERGSVHGSERGSPRRSSMPPTGQQIPMASRKEASAKGPGSYPMGSYTHPPHEAYYGREHRPAKQMHHGYPIAGKTTRSQGGSECASMAGTPDKVMVPRFGDWESAQSREGFTVIFDRVRDEKKSTATRNTPPRFISPRRWDEDLYKTSSMGRKRRGWLSLCCLASE